MQERKPSHSASANKGPMRMRRRGGPPKRKVCRFCADKIEIDYKNLSLLRNFITERGKILSGRVTGTCAKHQRGVNSAVKRARMLAFLPFTAV